MFGQLFNAISGFGLARQQKRASNAIGIDEGKFNYQTSQFAKDMLGNAQLRRNAQMPGMSVMQAQQNQAAANAMGAFGRGAGSGSNFLAMASANAAQQGNAGLGLAAQQAQWNAMENQNYNQALGNMQGEDRLRFQTAAQREGQREQRKFSLMDASQANKQRAWGQLGGFLDSAAQVALMGVGGGTGSFAGNFSKNMLNTGGGPGGLGQIAAQTMGGGGAGFSDNQLQSIYQFGGAPFGYPQFGPITFNPRFGQ